MGYIFWEGMTKEGGVELDLELNPLSLKILKHRVVWGVGQAQVPTLVGATPPPPCTTPAMWLGAP